MNSISGKQHENLTFRAFYLLAIFFVVDGHIPLEGELLNFGGLFRYYSFHLMMFAFGSGYFFHEDRKFLDSLRHDALHLLLPLYVMNCLYGIIALLIRKGMGSSLGADITFYTLLVAPITDGQHFVYNLGAWYLSALLICKTCYSLIYQLVKRNQFSDILAFICCLLIGSVSVILCRRQNNYPVFLLRAFIPMPAYALGLVYRKRLEEKDKLPTVPYLLSILLLRIIFTTCVKENTYILSDCSYMPCGPAGVYIGAVLAIAFYLRIAKLLGTYLPKCPFALFASQHTFDIMMHHGLGFFFLNCIFLLLNKFHLGAAAFDFQSLREVEFYTYAPEGHPEWAWLYVLAGFAFACILAFCQEKLLTAKKHLR